MQIISLSGLRFFTLYYYLKINYADMLKILARIRHAGT